MWHFFLFKSVMALFNEIIVRDRHFLHCPNTKSERTFSVKRRPNNVRCAQALSWLDSKNRNCSGTSRRLVGNSTCDLWQCMPSDALLHFIFFLAVLFYWASESWHAKPLVPSGILPSLRAWLLVSHVGHVIWANLSGKNNPKSAI